MVARRPSLTLIALLSSLPAQSSAPSASPFRFVPKDSVLIVQSDGLARWPARFAGTAAGKLFENELFSVIVSPLGDATEQFRQLVKTQVDFDLAPLIESLRGYGGRVTLFLHCPFREAFETLGQAALEGESAPATWGLVLEPDGKTDLGKIAASCKELRKAAGDRYVDRSIELGGRKWTGLSKQKSTNTILLPELDQGQLVVLAASDAQAQLPKLWSMPKESRFVPDPTAAAAGFWGRFTLTPALSAFRDWTKKDDSPLSAKRAYAIMNKLGLASVDAVELRADPAGKHVRLEASVLFHGAPAGIFSALIPEPDAVLTIHGLVPPGITTFSAGGMRWGKLYAILMETLEEFGDSIPISRDEIESGFEQETGVKLREDLLDKLGDEQILLGTVLAPLVTLGLAGMAEDPLAELGLVYGIRLKDGKAFGASVEKLVRHQGLHAARKTSEHEGVKVHELPLFGQVPTLYAVADDLALVAFGKKGKEQLIAVLAERNARAAKLPQAPFGASMAKRLAQLPSSFQGLQVLELPGALAAAQQGAIAGLERAFPGKSHDECAKIWADFRAAMHSLDLEHVVATEHVTQAKVTYLVLW